jgi:hypothetical protein
VVIRFTSVDNISEKYEITAQYTKDKLHDFDQWMAHDTGTYYVTNHDLIVACDIIAFGGDAVSIIIPPTIVPAYIVSAVSGTISYGLTIEEYCKGNITENDMLRAHIDWSTGLIPGWGIIPAAAQLGFDTGVVPWLK